MWNTGSKAKQGSRRGLGRLETGGGSQFPSHLPRLLPPHLAQLCLKLFQSLWGQDGQGFCPPGWDHTGCWKLNSETARGG